jgi:NADH:ubiquinone oxidoreductase subunit E
MLRLAGCTVCNALCAVKGWARILKNMKNTIKTKTNQTKKTSPNATLPRILQRCRAMQGLCDAIAAVLEQDEDMEMM